jgi:hypothetical protein
MSVLQHRVQISGISLQERDSLWEEDVVYFIRSWSRLRWDDGFESGDGNVDPEASPHRDIAPEHRKRLPTDASSARQPCDAAFLLFLSASGVD